MRRKSGQIWVICAILAVMMLPLSGGAVTEIQQPAELRSFSAALSPSGEVWAVWSAASDGTADLFYSWWTGRDWLPARPVYRNPAVWEGAPSLAFGADGMPWVAWVSTEEMGDTLYLSRWTGDGWAAPQPAPASETSPNREPVLATDPGGGLWLAWVGFDGNDDEIFAAFWNGQSWSEPQQVSSDDADPEAYDSQPRLAVGRDGSAWLAWTGYRDFLDDEVYAARWDGQRWLPEEQVSAADGAVAASPSLVVAEDGSAWLAWHARASEVAGQGRRVYVRQWTEADGWGREMLVSSPFESYVAEERPCLALGAGGLPQVSWRVAGGHQGVGFATFDGARWSAPGWAVQGAAGESLCVAGADQPLLLWWPVDPPALLPEGVWIGTGDLTPLPVAEAPGPLPPTIQVVLNRHLAFGDSITWGQFIDPETGQPVGDYPARLSQKLNSRVHPSEVINDGVPGERAGQGRWRLLDVSWPTYQPEFIELLEGTNDLTHYRPYNEIAEDLSDMVYYTKRAGSVPLLSTLLPRNDDRTRMVPIMNTYIANVADYRNVPLVDNYQAFVGYGDWRALLIDALHPNSTGMALMADTWYNALLAHTRLTEDTVPPTTWIEAPPPTSECGSVNVQWNGTDNVSWVSDYDVQVQTNGLFWTDWLLATPATSAQYIGGTYGDILSFRVRGRDAVGNQSNYSSAASTVIVDNIPPYEVGVQSLPPVQKGPFAVEWWGYDSCTPVTFDVQCSVSSVSNWKTWLSKVPYTSASFDPQSAPCGPVQYGGTYYFRAIAFDQAGRSTVSSYVSTVLARFTVEGGVYNIRHKPVAGASVSLSPAPLTVERRPGGYLAYLAEADDYDISAAAAGFGPLPAMQAVPVAADVSNLDFVLPPLDDVVSDGGFEGAGWGDWQPGGDVPPSLITGAHTGDGAALVGGPGGESWLSQPLSVPENLTDATLSFVVRLDEGSSGASELQVALVGTGISHNVAVAEEDWTHVWLPVDAAVGQSVTLTFRVSSDDAVRLDEISLGSAASGGAFVNLPVVAQGHE